MKSNTHDGHGHSRPLAGFAEIRGLGKQDAQRMLEEMAKTTVKMGGKGRKPGR